MYLDHFRSSPGSCVNAMPDAPGLPFLAWCSETVSDAGDMG